MNKHILDVEFIDGTATLTVPAFRDGGNIWCVHFALSNTGTLKNLDKNAEYSYQRFNPRNAQISEELKVEKTKRKRLCYQRKNPLLIAKKVKYSLLY